MSHIDAQIYRPRIAPITDEERPQWSVMIPAYNDGHYLEETLKSVLAQDPGPGQMQIEVIDDHSEKEDLEALVRRVGKGRVDYYRQPTNVKATRNFNTCLERSRGRWVHILHGDDFVLPGFYEKIGEAIRNNSEAGSVFCRNVYVDEVGQWTGLSGIEQRHQGIIPNFDAIIGKSQRIQFCSMVVKRSVYESIGGFDLRLIHAADWDMWKRVALEAPVFYVPELLGCYRVHSASHSSTLYRAGLNVADMRKAIAFSSLYYPAGVRSKVIDGARQFACETALLSAGGFLRKGDWRAGLTQVREALASQPGPKTFFRAAKLVVRSAMTFQAPPRPRARPQPVKPASEVGLYPHSRLSDCVPLVRPRTQA